MTDKLQALYSGLKDRYDLGSEDEFRNKMNDETKRKAFYDAVSPYYDLGDYDSFNDKLGYKKANAVETATEANRQMVDSITPAAQAEPTEVAMEPQSVEAPEPAPMPAPETEQAIPVAEPSRREQRRQKKQEKLEQGASIAKNIKDIAQGYKEQARIMREEDKDLERRYLELTTAAGNYATEQCGPMPRKGITSESGWGKAYMDYLNSNDPDNIRERYNNTKERSDRNNTVSFLEHMANQTERRANQSIAQAESSGVGRTARSIWYGLSQPGSWSLGMSDFWTAENVISLANKIKKGEKLTDYEQAALNAYGTYQEAAEILREYDTRGFKAGQTTGEMVPFMIQMALNPGGSLGTKAAQKGVQKAVSKAAAASGEEAAKAVAEQAMKEYGTMATRDLLRNYGVDGVMARLPIAMRKVGGDLAASAVLANTLQVGSTINDIAERKYGRPVMGEDGRYVFDPEQEKSSLEAIYKGEVAGIIENFTEMMGEWRVLGLADKMSKFGSKNMSRIVRALGDSDFAQGFSKVLRDAHWSGVFGETLEEEYGIILNSLLTGDNKLSDLYDLDQQIDIFLGVGLFGGLVGGAKVASYPTAYVNRKKHLEEVTAKCREWRGAEWDAIQEKIDNADNEGLAAIVKSALQEREAAGEKGREDGKAELILQYVDALQRFRGVTIARDLLPADADEKTMQAFYLQGYDGVDKEAIKAAYEHKKGQLQLIEPNFIKILDDEGINAQVRDVDGQMVNMFEGEYRRMALDYLNAKAAYDGMLDGITDRAQTAARSAEAIVRTNDNGGQQIEATTRTGEKVHIIDGGVTMIGGTADLNNSSKSIIIRHEDGKKEMVSPLFIKSVDNVQNTEEVARLASERAAQEVLFNESQEAEIQDVDAGMQAMTDVQLGEERGLEQAEYQQGDEVVLPDGTTGIINQGIGQTEDGKVEVIWNRPEGNTVEHLTADELYAMQHPTAQETVQEENVQDTEGAVRLSAQEQAVSDWEARHGDNAMNKLNQTKVYAEKQLAEKQEQLAKVQQELNDLPDIEDDATTKKVAELTKKKEDLEAGISQYSEVLDRMNTIEAGYAARNAQAEQPTAEEENVTPTAANAPLEATVPEAVESGLTPAEEKRINILLKRQQKRRLTKKEQKELDGLLAQSGLITDQSAVNPQTEEAINVVQASPVDETTKAAAKERLAELDAIAKSRMLTADEREEYLQANDLAYDVERAPKKEMKAARERIRAISTLQMQMPERSQRSAEEQQMFEELELLKLGAMQQLITEDDINEAQRLMDQYEKSTGIKMRLITDITKASRQDIMRAMNGRAWNDADNEVVFVLPRMLYEGVDLGQMFRHEVLSHFNLKNSMSEDEWNEFLDKVYEAMPKSERARLDRIYRGVYGRSSEQDYHRLLADEFIASNAEQLYGRAAGFRTVARKIVDAVRGWLNGGKQTTALTKESALPEFILSKLRDVYGQRIEKRDDNGQPVVRNSIAYHGSGADFDAFDSRFMSTGEGSQVYGWGVYVSTNKETGMAYADVANHPKVSYKGQEAPTSRTTDLLNGIIESLENGDDFEVAKSTTYKLWENSLKDNEKAFINGLQVSDFDIKAPDGQFLYTVDIPDDNGENYLHWDGILTKRQSEKIVNALLATPEVIDEFGEEAENEIRSALGYGTYGSQVEGGLNYFLGDMRNYATGEDMGAERNSKFLSNLGFVGMQVVIDRNGGKRFPGDNFVIYDDQDVKILNKTRYSIDGDFSPENDDIRYSITPEMDAEYRKAYEEGNIEKAQQMVKDAFKAAYPNTKVVDENGEPLRVYHFSDKAFTEFDKERIGSANDIGFYGNGFYFSKDRDYANSYGENEYGVFLNIEHPFIADNEKKSQASLLFNRDGDEMFESMVPDDLKEKYADDIRQADGVIHDGPSYFRGGQAVNEYVVSEPNQIKSAEPFTFDDNGVLIPLSERFNDENNDIRYSFVGENAADALKKNSGEWYIMYDLGQARKMEEQGRSAEWIKNVTGWERGADGKWRFEMEDFMLKPDYADAMKVGDAVQENRLLKAYPELKDMPVMFVHTDTPDTSVYDGTGFLIEYDNDDTAIKDLMHEIQHYIQEKEGFAEGSYPEMFSDNKEHPFLNMSSDKVARTMAKAQVAWDVDNDASLDDISKSLKKSQVGSPEYEAYSYIYVMAASGKSIREAKGEIIDEANKLRDDAIYLASDTNSPLNKYRRTAGEVEARNVQRRMGMTFEQRMKSLARATEDVDRKDQILIYSNAIDEFKEENEPIMNPLTELADVRYSISLEPSRIRSEYNNGDITVFSPRTIADVQAAVMRESFTHQDIRNINGWDDLKDAAYRMSGGEIATRALRNGLDFDAATEEWMYENAERMVVPFEIMMSRNGVELLYQMTGEEIRMYLASRNDLLDDADLFLAKEEMPTQPRVRYSSGSPTSARDLYDRSQESLANKLYRSYVDYTKPLRDLQNIIAKESGKPIEDFENALEAENQRSSKSKSEIEKFELEHFEKIRDAVKALEKATGMKYNDVLRYLIAKHGLERNVVLAQRDAEADFKKYQQENPNGSKTLDDFFNEKRERDYSGLTSLSGKDDVTDAELYAEDLVDSVDRLAPGETDDLWQTIADAVEIIQKKRYQSGMISKDQMKHEADMFEHYIPLRGFAETIAEDVYDYYENTTRNRPQRDKKAKGRTSLADDPLATLGAMAASAIVAGNKNLVKQRFLNMVENHSNDIATVKDVWVVNHGTDIDPVWEPEYPDIHEGMDADAIKAEIENYTQRMELLKAQGLAKKATNKLNIKWRTLGQQAQQHIITVRRNGQEQMIIINGNPQVARTVNGINNPDANLSDFMRGVRAVQRFMAANFTTRNPAFVVSNLARDLGFAVMAVTAKENADYRHRFMKNITGIIPKTIKMGTLISKWQKGTLDMNKDVERYFAEFMENGGETGYTAENTVDAFRKKMEQGLKDKNFLSRGWETVLEYFELCNRSVEDFTRFMTFMTSRQMGRSMQRSVSDAKNITVNFNRKGSGEMGQKYIASAYLFLNAGIQSLQNVAKMSGIELNMDDVSGKIKLDINKGKLAKSAATLFGSQIVLGMLIPMLNELMMGIIGGDDDDEPEADENGVVISTNPYRRLTEFERRNNICIWLGGDSFIKIPIAIELRAFYGLGETLYGMMAGIPNPNPGADVVDQMLDLLPVNFIENGGLVPDAVAPFWESFITNRNYQGVPLYNDSDFLEQSPEASKAYSNTGDLYMTISRWVNELGGGDEVHKSKLDTRLTNPAIMQHIVEGYLGGLLTTSRQTVKLLGQPVKKFIMGKEVEAIPAREWPVVNRLYINTDKRNDDRYVKDRYYYYRDKAEQIRHDERGYLDRIDDPRYAEKYEELVNSPEYLEYITFGAYDKWVKEAHKDVKDYGDEFKVFEVDAMRELVNALDEETKGVIDPEQWGKNLRGK